MTVKKFFHRENKDAGKAFLSALLSAGYLRIGHPIPESGITPDPSIIDKADFLLMDHDYAFKPTPAWSKHFTPEALEKHPMFIYPHAPYSWFLWDGIFDPKPVACNFVVSNGAKIAMQIYGYPYPVEVVGFAGVEVKQFQQTQGTRLLFAPAHPIHNGKFPMPEGLNRVREASQKIVKYLDRFESVTVRYSHTLELSGLEAFRDKRVIFEHYDPYNNPNIREQALESISRADLVISQSTFGYLSVASGKPTIFYGYRNMIPHSREGYVKNYQLYKSIFYFPLLLEEMTIDEIKAVRNSRNEDLESWKCLNIGGNFDADKFISIVREHVSY